MKIKLLLSLFLIPFVSFSQVLKGTAITGLSSTNSARASVALSSNGNTLIASGPYNGAGIAKVFEFQNNDWVQLGSDLFFPYSVSISSDGTIIAGGSIKAGNLDNGAVAVYRYVNNVWEIIGSLIVGEANFDELGYQVVLSSDGTIVAASAILNDANGSKSGHVRVYRNISDVWTQIGSDIDGDAVDDNFGTDIALSDDGTIIAISSPFNNANGNDAGQVKIFKNVNDVWTQIGNDLLGDGAGNRFGTGVSMSSDGNSVVISAPTSSGSNNNPSQNSYYKVFENINDVWTQKGTTISRAERGGLVSMSGDGNFIILKQQTGFVYIYEFKNNDWTQIGTVSQRAKDFYVSKDASTLALGRDQSRAPVEVYNLNGLTLGVENFVNSDVKIFPNPVKTNLHIQLTNNVELKQVKIYNMLGKEILKSNTPFINVSRLSKGIYFVEITTNRGKQTTKLLKE